MVRIKKVKDGWIIITENEEGYIGTCRAVYPSEGEAQEAIIAYESDPPLWKPYNR